jgi:hypothetical protein
MCQKASGNYFMPLAASALTQFEMTRGEAAWFQSSDHVRRGFGSLDEPQRVRPEAQSNLTAKMHWFGALDGLPVEPEPATDSPPPRVNNLQHPDHDTAEWPAKDDDP